MLGHVIVYAYAVLLAASLLLERPMRRRQVGQVRVDVAGCRA